MTDDEIIKRGLIELLIKVNHFDEGLAKGVREARADDSPDELIVLIRERLELDEQITETLANMPASLREAIDRLKSL